MQHQKSRVSSNPVYSIALTNLMATSFTLVCLIITAPTTGQIAYTAESYRLGAGCKDDANERVW